MTDYEKNSWLTKILTNRKDDLPYMLVDLGIVKQHCRTFKQLFPKVKLFYAMKALSDEEILRTVDPLVDGYDAASIAEIITLINMGVNADRIAYSNPVKPEAAIKQSVELGVHKFAFQSKDELAKISRCLSNADVYVRVKMDDSHSAVPLSVKYGCSQDEAVDLLLYAQRIGLNPIGLTFHIGSQQTGLTEWPKATKKAQEIVKAARSLGINLSLVNLGGGFPARYSEEDPPIEQVAEAIMPVLDTTNFEYMAEPGRYIVAESAVIVASVIGIEERGERRWAYLDVGLFQAFTGAQRFEPFPYPPLSLRHADEKEEGEVTSYILTGPSCDSHDIICNDALLPSDLQVGDRIVFPKTGAYTVVYGSIFNGFPIPKRYYIDSTEKVEG